MSLESKSTIDWRGLIGIRVAAILKNAFRSISCERSTLRQKVFRPFLYIIKFIIFLYITFFVTLIFSIFLYLQNYLFEYLLNRLLLRENTYDQTCRASNSLDIVTETFCSIINIFKDVLRFLLGAARNLHKMYSISSGYHSTLI